MQEIEPEDKVSLIVQGMTCNHCASTVNGILQQEGGSEIHVDYLMGEANFQLNDSKNLEKILKRLADAGYKSHPENSESTLTKSGLGSIEKKFLFTLPFSLILMSHMFLAHDSLLNNPWIQLILCTPVFIVGLLHFGKSSWEGIKSRTLSMDVLILLGSSSAFGYSLYGAIAHENAHQYLFFETTSTIITLVLLGYVIEHRAVQKTTTVLRELIKSKPEKAKKLVRNGLNQDLVVVKADDLEINDIVLVNSGDRIPADGKIIYGDIELNESMLTGESQSVFKHKGDSVHSGSILLNGNGTVKVEKVGKDSTIGQIISLVQKSRADKPAIQKLADRISTIFVPSIILIALLSLIINFFFIEVGISESIIRSVAVLVIACPCAMGLATPTAVSVGLGLAGKIGIIIKKASSFEELNSVKHFIFDKTGTLTKGELSLVLNNVYGTVEQEEVWKIVKALEERSSHPISKAIMNLTQTLEPAIVERIEEMKGLGMQGDLNSKKVKFGNAVFIGKGDSNRDLFLSIDGIIVADFNVVDQLKPDSTLAVNLLQESGKRVSVLSGDNERKTKDVAEQLGIKDFHFSQLPEEKLAFIKSAKKQGLVAMIGDGINDSPALSASDVGISMGTANALAAESAKIVILGSSLHQFNLLMKISKEVVKTIKQNLFWAFSYNIIAIPLAALGYLDPMLAALSMAFSDVIVIGNSLRLRLILSQKLL